MGRDDQDYIECVRKMTLGEFFDLCNPPPGPKDNLANRRNMEKVLHLILWEAKESYPSTNISFWALNIVLQVIHHQICPLNGMHAGIATYSMAVIADRFLRATDREEWKPKTLTALRKIAGSVELGSQVL